LRQCRPSSSKPFQPAARRDVARSFGLGSAALCQPQSVTNLAGTTAIFSVAVTGTPPFAYQWFFNSSIALSGDTTPI